MNRTVCIVRRNVQGPPHMILIRATAELLKLYPLHPDRAAMIRLFHTPYLRVNENICLCCCPRARMTIFHCYYPKDPRILTHCYKRLVMRCPCVNHPLMLMAITRMFRRTAIPTFKRTFWRHTYMIHRQHRVTRVRWFSCVQPVCAFLLAFHVLMCLLHQIYYFALIT